MHFQACLLGEAVEDAKSFGWKLGEGKTHDWSAMVNNVQVQDGDHLRCIYSHSRSHSLAGPYMQPELSISLRAAVIPSLNRSQLSSTVTPAFDFRRSKGVQYINALAR